ncbi:MAG: purine-nucleoside phosphorylase [bacterium]|nr:purine-nucleoside phosphorylase [bacterium]
MATIHIESKKEDIADIVLMPGDPNRALYIANKYLKKKKLVNSVRGMTAYTGKYQDKLITIFPSGMGCPSIGIYSYELFNNYGVKTIIRLGSCGSYQEDVKLNDVILVDKSCSQSSFAKIQNKTNSDEVEASISLNDKIYNVARKMGVDIKRGNIYCTDVFYEQDNNYRQKVIDYNALGVEMETFALFHNAKVLNKDATALLTVTDLFYDDAFLSSDERERKLNTMIEIALNSIIS